MIPIEPCDESRRAICLHRFISEKELGIYNLCTSNDTVLKGCPNMKLKVGCLSKHDCDSFSKLTTTIINGKKHLSPIKCEHHPDRMPIDAPVENDNEDEGDDDDSEENNFEPL